MSEFNYFIEPSPTAFGDHPAANGFMRAVFNELPESGPVLPLPKTRIAELEQQHNLTPGQANALAYLAKHKVANFQTKIARLGSRKFILAAKKPNQTQFQQQIGELTETPEEALYE